MRLAALLGLCLTTLALGDDAMTPADKPTITGVTKTGPTLVQPVEQTEGQTCRYGLGFVFQIGPQTAAVSVNVRTAGVGHWDFENGSDIVVFDDLANVAARPPIVCARNTTDTDPQTGKRRVAIHYPVTPGFWPLGARRGDATEHPAAGTGFGFSQVLHFDLNDEGFFSWDDPYEQSWFVYQFAWDGSRFLVTHAERRAPEDALQIGDGPWRVVGPGITCAIADGDDLLYPVLASDSSRNVSGVTRWRSGPEGWRPVVFHGISGGYEPSLVRDTDGALLYTARDADADGNSVRVWRSTDAGENWYEVLHDPKLRSNAPMVLNRAVDGTPYLAANHPKGFRNVSAIWPLTVERDRFEPPVIARDCDVDFGAPPEKTTWFADHPVGAVVRLRDGRWHGVVGYRVMAFSFEGLGGETLAPQTGCYIEEVSSTGPTLAAWEF